MKPAAFHEERRQGIGGSDAGALYNLDYGCRLATWFSKRNVRPDYEEEETSAQRRGTLLEDDVIEEYRIATGRKVSTIDTRRVSKEYPFMAVNVDGWIEEDLGFDKGVSLGVLECKVLSRESFRRQTKGGLLESYVLQLQHAMSVTGLRWGSFAILCVDPWKLAHFDVRRDENLIRALVQEEEAFWKEVTEGPQPEPLPDIKDKRCRECQWRRTCRGDALLNVLPEEDRGEIEHDPTLAQIAQEYEEAGDLVDEAEEYKEQKKKELVAALAGRNSVDTGTIRVYHRPHPVTRWDEKALTARLKSDGLFRQLLEKYRRTSTQQPLRTYKI